MDYKGANKIGSSKCSGFRAQFKTRNCKNTDLLWVFPSGFAHDAKTKSQHKGLYLERRWSVSFPSEIGYDDDP